MAKKAQSDTLNTFFEPMFAFNALALSNAEKLVELNLDACKRYTQASLEQAKAALELRSSEDLEGFMKASKERGEAVTQAARDDAQAVAGISAAFVAEAQELVKGSMQKTA